MTILALLMWSRAEINSDSNYAQMTAWCRGVLKRRPHWTVVVPFPDKTSGYKYDDDGFWREMAGRVVRLPQRMSTRKRSASVTFDGIWWDKVLRQIAFNVIWANQVEIAGHVRAAGQGAIDPVAIPATIAAHHFVVHPTLPTYPGFENVQVAQLMGAILADHNVVNSAYCEWMLRDNAERYLSPATVERIWSKLSHIPLGVLDPAFRRPRRWPKNDVPVIAYNHRLQSYKKYKDTFRVLGELWDEGLRFRVRVTTSTADLIGTIRTYPFVEIHFCPTREEYLNVLGGCDLNVTNSVHETFCISAVESMAFGQPIVAPDGITFPAITGRDETGYPYLFTTEDEQKEMVRRLVGDADERHKWGKTLSEYVLREYNHDLWAERYVDLIETVEASHRPNPSQDALEFLVERLREMSGEPVADVLRAVVGKKVNGRIPFGPQALPMTKFARIIHDQGGHIAFDAKGRQCVYATGPVVAG